MEELIDNLSEDIQSTSRGIHAKLNRLAKNEQLSYTVFEGTLPDGYIYAANNEIALNVEAHLNKL